MSELNLSKETKAELLKRLEILEQENQILKSRVPLVQTENLVTFSTKIPDSIRTDLKSSAKREDLRMQDYVSAVLSRGLYIHHEDGSKRTVTRSELPAL